MEEVDDLLQGLFGLVLTGHVRKGHAGGFLHIDLGVGFPHAADAAEAAAPPGHHIHKNHDDADEDDHGQDIRHHEFQHRTHLRDVGIGVLLHPVLVQHIQEALVVGPHLHGKEGEILVVLPAVLIGVGVALHGGDLQHPVLEQHRLHLAVPHQVLELAVHDLMGGGGGSGLAAVGGQIVDNHCQANGPGNEDQQAVYILFVLIIVVIIGVSIIIVHHILL